MKIYINGRFLSQRVTGVQRYAQEIVKELDKVLQEKNTDNEWCILVPKNRINDLSTNYIKVKKCGKLTGHLWEQFELPFYAKDGFLVNLCNCAPLLKKNQLVTIHDAAVVAFPQAYSWQFRMWYKFIYTVCGKRADRIVTVSKFSRNELNKYFNIDIDKISVIYNGIEHVDCINEDKSIIYDLNLVDKKYVLGVGSRSVSKNFKLIMQAAEILSDVQFVIVGGANENIFRKNTNAILPNVIFTGYVTDEKLISLYRHAMVFVYPSKYEGFGIPPLEAISQGCPVIVSKCAALPEICGEMAEYCSEKEPDELVRKIRKKISMETRKKSNFMMAAEMKYSWRKSAILFRELIENE